MLKLQNSNNLEMQKANTEPSLRKGMMKLTIACQAVLGLIMCCLGIGLIQTFHVKNFSEDQESMTDWHFDSVPDFTWIFTCAVGLIVFLYGFIGFWLCERKRKVWRVNLHLLLKIVLMLMTIGTVACMVLFEKEKVGQMIVWSTLIVQGWLLVCQIWGIIDQLLELRDIQEEMDNGKRYHPRTPESQGPSKKSMGVGLGEKLGIIG